MAGVPDSVRSAPGYVPQRKISPTQRPFVPANFWAKVERRSTGDCWPWRGHIDKAGYGKWLGRSAHRWAYIDTHGDPGPFPLNLLCRNRACVNPAHLEVVTAKVNRDRRVLTPRTHCRHGHELTDDNVKIETTKAGHTLHRCWTCRREQLKKADANRWR